jgi:hypothetical protein
LLATPEKMDVEAQESPDIRIRQSLISRDKIKSDGESLPAFEEANNLTFSLADESLMNAVDMGSLVLFVVCGLIWRKSDETNILVSVLHLVWNVFVLGLMALGYGIYSYECFRFGSLSGALVGIAVILQGLGLYISTCYNILRLRGKYVDGEPKVFREVLPAIIFLGVAMTLISVPILHYPGEPLLLTLLFMFVFIIGNFLLAANVMFVCVDARFCSRMLEGLYLLGSTHGLLQQNQVEVVRIEIRRRSKDGYIVHTAIITAALANVVSAFAVEIIIEKISMDNFILYITTFLFRGLFVSLATFWNGALVNEMFDRLVQKVGARMSVSIHGAFGYDQYKDCALVVSLQSQPLTFSLAGMTLRRSDVLFRFGIWLFGTLVGAASKSFS